MYQEATQCVAIEEDLCHSPKSALYTCHCFVRDGCPENTIYLCKYKNDILFSLKAFPVLRSPSLAVKASPGIPGVPPRSHSHSNLVYPFTYNLFLFSLNGTCIFLTLVQAILFHNFCFLTK